MYVRSLSIQNLRSFESEELPLCHPGAGASPPPGSVPHLDNITLLLGTNGAGKTTVLRAVALSTLAPVLAMGSGYVPYALVRRVRGKPTGEAHVEARVVLQEQDGLKEGEELVKATLVAPRSGYTDRFTLPPNLPRWQLRLYEEEESPSFLVLGYGATRRVETGPGSLESRAKERVLRYRRVAGLFEEHMTLMSLSAWLPRVKDRKRQQEVVKLLNALLPDTELLRKWGDPENPECLFRRGQSVLPYPALSDGYRAFICWVGDLLYHLHTICPKGQHLVDMAGVVLVDEVDLHLHPEWQRRLVPTLSRTLPRLQFILTSHSPIVVGTLSSQNVLLLTEQTLEEGARSTRVVRPGEELHGLSADQILTSDSFGMESTRDERFFERLKEVAGQAREGGAEDALRFMRMVAGGAAAENTPPSSHAEQAPLVLEGHERGVHTVVWAPDGRRVAAVAMGGTVRVWDTQSGSSLRSLGALHSVALAIAFSPDGLRMASAKTDGSIHVLNFEHGRFIRKVPKAHVGPIRSLSFSRDGSRLASAEEDGAIHVRDMKSGRRLPSLGEPIQHVLFMSFSQDGRRFAAVDRDGTVHVWDVKSGHLLPPLKGRDPSISSVSLTSDGRRLASAGVNGIVRVWDTDSGSLLRASEGHKPLKAVSLSPDGRLLAHAGEDGSVSVCETESGRLLRSLEGHNGTVRSVSVSPDGRRLASAGDDGLIRLWEIGPDQKRAPPRRKAPRRQGRK